MTTERSRISAIISAGCINGILAVTAVASYGMLIFSGSLSAHATTGIAVAFTSAFIVALAVALTSSYHATLAIPNPNAVAVIAFLSGSVAASLPAGGSADTLLSTVIASMGVACAVTGIVFLLLGVFRFGRLIRFIPYPVVGGFMAGSGWLLSTGAVRMMVNHPLPPSDLGVLLQPEMLARWVPVVLYGLILFMVMKWRSHYLTLPVMLIAGVGVFYIALALAGITPDQAGRNGWLMGPFPAGGLLNSVTLPTPSLVQWSAVAGTLPEAVTLAMVSVLSLLLTASGIEVAVGKDVDLDKELKVAGTANLIMALPGGVVGFHNMAATVLNFRMGAESRWTGLVVAIFFGFTLFVGPGPLSYFPKPVLGGLLLFFGISFLYEWVVDARKRIPSLDYAIVVLILLVVAFTGFLQGIAVGILAGMVLFVVNYSRISVVKYEVTGDTFHSNVDRPPAQQSVLREQGARILLLKLQGFIFFGTANTLLTDIRKKTGDQTPAPAKYLILDFSLVNGLDSSAVISFQRMMQQASQTGAKLCLTGLSDRLKKNMTDNGLLGQDGIEVFNETDEALERCENDLLHRAKVLDAVDDNPLDLLLRRGFPRQGQIRQFLGNLEKIEFGSDHRLIRQGSDSDALYFLAHGRADVLLEDEDGRASRLRSVGPGNVIGEIAFYLSRPRTATVVTRTPCTLYRLSAQRLKEMETEAPDLTAGFHCFMAHFLADRLVKTNQLLTTLMA